MPIVAGTIIVGNTTISGAQSATSSADIALTGSFQYLRDKAYSQQAVENNPKKVPTRSPKYHKRANGDTDKLIQYKESAFISDMLSSSKD